MSVTTFVHVYLCEGDDEDCLDNYIFVDLVVRMRAHRMTSSVAVDDLTAEQFNDHLGIVLNTAGFLAKGLNIPLHINDDIQDYSAEISDKSLELTNQLIEEVS